MPSPRSKPSIRLPKGWHASVKAAVLQVISLAQYALVYARGWAADSINTRLRLKAENERLRQEVALLREEIRIKNARMTRIEPQRRPHYPPTERMAILELKAARGWSLEQAARAFQVTSATIASWMKRLDEEGPAALVQVRQPVNKFPEFVRLIVQRLKALCPTLGKLKAAEMLARAGLHLAATTIGRILKEEPQLSPARPELPSTRKQHIVTAKYPNHLWRVDLTVVPTLAGMWCAWLPFALPQRWPFAWWLGVVVDHFSRRVTGFAAFDKEPSSQQVRLLLGRAIAAAGEAPRHLVCDRGGQFDCDGFRRWCRRKGIQPPRYGAVGKHGSLAVIERLILTLKLLLRSLPHVPLRREPFRREVALAIGWYNEHRPHTTLCGKTPNEVYFARHPANRKPRSEPRARWPRASPCAKPWALVRGTPGAALELDVEFHATRRHLPIVRVNRVA